MSRAIRAQAASALRLRAARSATSRGEKALTAYSVIIALLIYGTPALLAARDGWGAAAGSPAALLTAGVVICAAFFVAGGSRGPLAFSRGDVDLLLAGPAPRSAIFAARPVVLALVFATAGALVGAITLTEVVPPAPGAGRAIAEASLAGATLGIGALVAWTLGEVDRRFAWLVAPAAVAAAAAAVGVDAGAAGLWTFPPLWGSALAAPSAQAALLACAIVGSIVLQRAVLARSRGERLRRQAAVWDRARIAAATLDLRTATGALADPPRFLRRARLARVRAVRDPILARDLLGAARRWPRTVAALAAATGGCVLVCGAWSTPWSITGAVLASFGASMAASGLRAHAEHLAKPHLLDPPTAHAAWRHAALPAAVLAAALALTAPAAAILGALSLGGWLTALAVAAMAVALQITTAYRFRAPEALQAPVTTPAGDMSLLVIGAWWVRTYLFLAGVVWALGIIADPLGRAIVLACGVVVSALWARGAFRAERRDARE